MSVSFLDISNRNCKISIFYNIPMKNKSPGIQSSFTRCTQYKSNSVHMYRLKNNRFNVIISFPLVREFTSLYLYRVIHNQITCWTLPEYISTFIPRLWGHGEARATVKRDVLEGGIKTKTQDLPQEAVKRLTDVVLNLIPAVLLIQRPSESSSPTCLGNGWKSSISSPGVPFQGLRKNWYLEIVILTSFSLII